MKDINIIGNVGRTPEIRVSQDGKEYATFSVGVNVGKDKTDWCDVSVSGKQIDVVRNYVKKGTKILVQGFPAPKAYLSRDGKPLATLQIYARNIELLSKKEDHEEPTYNLPPIDESPIEDGFLTSDNIPF
jgi:single-strand DNA-binding protein